jgi:putative ABC transport system permease protein
MNLSVGPPGLVIKMGVIGFKIFRDLWGNKGRTFQVVLIIALGAAAIGMILGTRNLVIPGMESQWQSIHPAMINIFISPSINDDDLISLKKEDGVVDIEGSGNTTVEWRVNPTDEWKSGALTFRTDYSHQELNVLERIEGNWPAGKTISIGQGDDSYFKIPKNGTIYLRYNDKIFTLHTGGVVYNMATQPAYFGGSAQFYIDRDEYENIINDRNFNLVLVTGAQYDVKKTAELGDNLQKQIERMGSDSGRQINDPKKHPFQDSLDGVFFLLGVLGAFALILGLLLVYNTINAIISQQVDQIGIMKAIGARTGHILRLYLTSILIYSLFAVLVAIPLGTLGAWAISNWLVGSFGASTGPFEYSPPAVWIMIAIIFLAPMLAALIPIFSGARITVREAISTYGLRTTTGLIERLLAKVRAISRMLLLTISNTFRNKGRVTLLQISLVLSGLIFMMVISVQDSVVYTVRDILFSILNANITFLFDDPYRINYIEDVTLSYPGVKAVEMWGFGGGKIRPMGKPESEDDKSASLMGVPLPTQTYGYQLRGGRWLDPSDSRAIVLNTKLAKDVGVGVGDWVTVKYGEKNEANWRVVGLVFDPVLTTFALVPREALGIDQGSVGRAQSAWILTDKGDLETEVSMAKGLRAYYKKLGIKVNAQPGIFGLGGDSTTQTANTLINQFNFLVILLGIMAVIIGAVGSIALSGALSLSVIERRREIGVMRAIGASSWTIARLFIGEGLIQGWLSWLIALPISLPAGKFMVQALGQAFQIDIVYKFTPMGAILWFGIITILSIIASWLPARGATHISVRESLAYQ